MRACLLPKSPKPLTRLKRTSRQYVARPEGVGWPPYILDLFPLREPASESKFNASVIRNVLLTSSFTREQNATQFFLLRSCGPLAGHPLRGGYLFPSLHFLPLSIFISERYFAMTDFKDLDPETRCYALVGQFLQAWSAMELSLREVIGAALKIESVQLQIIYANLGFRDKTTILRTLIDVSPMLGNEKAGAKLKLRKLSKHSAKRNMIAHDRFGPDESKTGVEFFTVRASGTFEIPKVIWKPKQFEQEISLLCAYRAFLNDLEKRFKEKPLTEQSYTAAVHPFVQVDWNVPMRRTMSPVLLDYLSRPPQFLDTGPASPIQSTQIPEKREK